MRLYSEGRWSNKKSLLVLFGFMVLISKTPVMSAQGNLDAVVSSQISNLGKRKARETESFIQKLMIIFDIESHKHRERTPKIKNALTKKINNLINQQSEIELDLVDIGFVEHQLHFLFENREKFELSSIVAKNNSDEFCLFSIYKGEPIQRKKKIKERGLTLLENQKGELSKDQEIKEFFISGDFPSISKIDLAQNGLKVLNITSKLPKLRELWLGNNKLLEFRGSIDFPKLKILDISDNKLLEVNLLTKFPKLKILDTSGNPLELLFIPNPNTLKELYSDTIESVTTFHDNGAEHTFKNKGNKIIFNYKRSGEVSLPKISIQNHLE